MSDLIPRTLLTSLTRQRPACIFGAAGTGKSTLAEAFAARFSNRIHLDLETPADRAVFDHDPTAAGTLEAISFLKGREIRGSGTLLVLDEIGQCPAAIRWVRRQVERTSAPGQPKGPYLLATSSFTSPELEALTDPSTGAMEPRRLHPLSFAEFLTVMDDPAALEAYGEVPVPTYAYRRLLDHFHLHALIGGLPEVVTAWAVRRQASSLKKIYEHSEERFIDLLTSVTGGTRSHALAAEVLQNAWPYAATRIRYNGFGNLGRGSRDIGQAFRALESAFLLRLVHPVTAETLPASPGTGKLPLLLLCDTGLVSYFSGIQKPLFASHDMNAIFRGQVARQAVAQELAATTPSPASPAFWVRDKAQSTAEVDFVIPHGEWLVPVVVKSGAPGRLRSLHEFIDRAPHPFAVRLQAGELGIQQTETIRGKKFFLLNLPYFLAGKIHEHLDGFARYVG